MNDHDDLLTKIKTYLETPGDANTAFKQEIIDLVSPKVVSTPHNSGLVEGLQNLRLTNPKFPKYEKGDSFVRYCDKFQEYVLLTNQAHENLYLYFLQNVDDETYAKLKLVKLTDAQKLDATSFCQIYKQAIYGEQIIQLVNEVRDCLQQEQDSISDYAY